MAQHCIKGKRIRRVCIPKEYDIDKIQIGIPVICDEAVDLYLKLTQF